MLIKNRFLGLLIRGSLVLSPFHYESVSFVAERKPILERKKPRVISAFLF